MYEIECSVCNRVIGFRDKKLYGTVKKQSVVKCIDCYFLQIKDIMQQNKRVVNQQ